MMYYVSLIYRSSKDQNMFALLDHSYMKNIQKGSIETIILIIRNF